jgi:hypothetical protein
MSPCTCGHPREAHEHYRRGTDCSACLCPRYDRGSWWRLGLAPRRRWLPKAPVPVDEPVAGEGADEQAS